MHKLLLLLLALACPISGQDYGAQIAEVSGRIFNLKIKIGNLEEEKEQAIKELRAGAYCSECKRTRSEINRSGERFEEHVRRVKGEVVPASPAEIAAKSAEFDRQIAALRREIDDLLRRKTQLADADSKARQQAEAARLAREEANKRRQQEQIQAENDRRREWEAARRERQQRMADDLASRRERDRSARSESMINSARAINGVFSDSTTRLQEAVRDQLDRQSEREQIREEARQRQEDERERRRELAEQRRQEQEDDRTSSTATVGSGDSLDNARENYDNWHEHSVDALANAQRGQAIPMFGSLSALLASTPVAEPKNESVANNFESLFDNSGTKSQNSPPVIDLEQVAAGLFDRAREGKSVTGIKDSFGVWFQNAYSNFMRENHNIIIYGTTRDNANAATRLDMDDRALWESTWSRVIQPFSVQAGFEQINRFSDLFDTATENLYATPAR